HITIEGQDIIDSVQHSYRKLEDGKIIQFTENYVKLGQTLYFESYQRSYYSQVTINFDGSRKAVRVVENYTMMDGFGSGIKESKQYIYNDFRQNRVVRVVENYSYYGDVNSLQEIISSVQYFYNIAENGSALRVVDTYDVIGSQEPGRGQYIHTTRDTTTWTYKDSDGDAKQELVKVTTTYDRVGIGGVENFIASTRRETYLTLDSNRDIVERSVNYEYGVPSTDSPDIGNANSMVSGIENEAAWVRSGIDDRKKEYRKDPQGRDRLALVTKSYSYEPGYNNDRPIINTETESFRYVKEVDGKNRIVAEVVSYEFYGSDNLKLLTGRKIVYSDWDAKAGAIKLVEIMDEFVDFDYKNDSYYINLYEFGEIKIPMPARIFFDEWDPEKQEFRKVDAFADTLDSNYKASYKGFLALQRKETLPYYEAGYRTGIDVRYVNRADPQYYSLSRIIDKRNSKGVKIGYITEFYNDGRTLTRRVQNEERDEEGRVISSNETQESTVAYTATTIFKRNAEGYLVGEITLTVSSATKDYKYENILSYDRDSSGRIQGFTKLIANGDGSVIGRLGNFKTVIVEKTHFMRDPVTHLRTGEIVERWKGDNWYNFTTRAPDTIAVNPLIDVQRIVDPTTGEVRIIKVRRSVEYQRQLSGGIPDQVWQEMYDRAMGDLSGRIDIYEPGYDPALRYIYTTSNNWTESIQTYDAKGRLLSEENTIFNIEFGRHTVRKDYTYELSDSQRARGLTLDSFMARPTGWIQSGKRDSICVAFGLDENGYTDVRVDVYYDPTTGYISEQDGSGGRGVSQRESLVTYYTVYDDGRTEGTPDVNEFLSQNGYSWQFQNGAVPEISTVEHRPEGEGYYAGMYGQGYTEYQVKVKQGFSQTNLGDSLDQKNLTY
ncbi:MAG: hypothetical protein AABY55_05065, partial [Candidatus Omnitrophota bacterium]